MATYSDKIERIKKNIQSRTGLSNLVPGSMAFQFIEAVSYEAMQLEFKMEEYTRRVSLLTSTGKDLDNIGKKIVGLDRLGTVAPFVTKSMKAIKFYVKGGVFGDLNKDTDGNTRDIYIPEGVAVSGNINGKIVKLRISKAITLLKYESEMFVDAEYIEGPLSTIPTGIIKTHNFKNYTQAINERLLVSNPVPIGTGRETESDENYRYRLINSPKAIPKTTYQGVYESATMVNGVSNIFIEQASNGGGTFTIYVQGITPITADEVVEDVMLKIEDTVSPWVSFIVKKPNYIGLAMSFTVETFGAITNPNVIVSKVEALVSDQVNNFYGSEFQINSILRTVYSAHQNITRVTFDYVNIYTGAGDIRGYIEVDFDTNPDPVLYLNNKEKLIIEPVHNSISLSIG
jgi:uncharacterized phage protein gp47/JayE